MRKVNVHFPFPRPANSQMLNMLLVHMLSPVTRKRLGQCACAQFLNESSIKKHECDKKFGSDFCSVTFTISLFVECHKSKCPTVFLFKHLFASNIVLKIESSA